MVEGRSVQGVWQIVIFVVDGIDNHCGLDIPEHGLADCSLAGTRVIDWEHLSCPKGHRLTYAIHVPFPELGLAYARQPGTLAPSIIAEEKKQRGWHLTPDAPGFVRTLRDRRSSDPEDMNCVEWIWYVLERAGVEVPDNVLTPQELREWCEARA